MSPRRRPHISLLSPAGAMHRHNGSFSRHLHYAPLTLTTLAALVPSELEAVLSIHDETVGAIPPDLEADLVGITAITGTAERAYAWADHFRLRGATVVLGGIHPTLLPEEAARHADAVVRGYAEESWPRLLRDWAAGSMQSSYEPLGPLNLAGQPTPRRDLLARRRYATCNTVEACRGCIHSCSFCVVPSVLGAGAVHRPVREVVREVEQLPGKLLLFPDVNLLNDKAWFKELLRELTPLKRWWFGLSTARIGEDRELLDLLAASGCKGLLIGFESVNGESLKAVNKSFGRVSQYGELMRALHGRGISVNGCFALGTDDDGPDVFERTVEMVEELKVDLPRFSVITPFPGTQLHREMEAAGRIFERRWPLYDVEHVVFQPARMSPAQLEEGLAWTWDQTYRAGGIAKRLAQSGLQPLLSILPNLGYRHYAAKLRTFTPHVMTDNSDIHR